jgi:alpha-tubulin suppressor-like RCC1 family protein
VLSAANFRTCGLTEEGSAFCWSGYGSTPAPVPGDLKFRSLSVSHPFACALSKEDGHAYCWEFEDWATVRLPGPRSVPGGISFREVHTSSAFPQRACGLAEDGRVHCWTVRLDGPTLPEPIPGQQRFHTMALGSYHGCGVTEAGAAYCWGMQVLDGNIYGQLGDGSTEVSLFPVSVIGGMVFESVAAGGMNSCGIATDGAGYCWGGNTKGQLGDGSDVLFSPVPVRVRNP